MKQVSTTRYHVVSQWKDGKWRSVLETKDAALAQQVFAGLLAAGECVERLIKDVATIENTTR